MCGAEFPLKVAVLGEGTAMGYGDDLRPPAGIPNASPAQPNWPPAEQRYYPPPAPMRPVQSAPIQSGNMRWVPGPPPAERPEVTAPSRYEPPDEEPDERAPPRYAPPPPYPQRIEQREEPAPAGRPMSIYAPGVAAPDDIPDDAVLPPGRAARLTSARSRPITRRSISRRRSAPCPRSGRCAARTRPPRSCRRR